MNELSAEYKTAVKLNQKIIFAAQMAQKNLYDMCVMLKEMRDNKLYKELGYQNFEVYCENEVGFNRSQAHKYISIIENVSENVYSSKHFGVTKLYLLSSLSESQQEELQEKVKVEDVSVRELKEEIKKLKDMNEATEKQLDDTEHQLREENTKRIHLQSDLLSIKSKNRSLTHDLDTAQKKITELENRPATVVEDMQAKVENEQLRAELEQAKQTIEDMERSDMSYELKNAKAAIRELDRQLSIESQDNANTQNRMRRQYQDEINELKRQLETAACKTVETVEVPAVKEVFEAYCSVIKNAFGVLLDFVCRNKEYIKPTNELLDELDDALCDI